jgi:DNA invertase Pin-like site-specific DNA recombinase
MRAHFHRQTQRRAGRTSGLNEALSHLRQADTLEVWKLDRLGRSVKGLVDLVNELETQKVHFQSITDGIDTKTPARPSVGSPACFDSGSWQ